jgi:RNA-directed DNA polymerase
MTRIGPRLNEAQTSLRDGRCGGLDFLGYRFGRHYPSDKGELYLGASPSRKSVQRLKTEGETRWSPARNAHGLWSASG